YQQVQWAQYFAATFAFRPLCFQDFTSIGEGGGGGLYPFVSTSRFPSIACQSLTIWQETGSEGSSEFRAETHSFEPCEYVGTRLYSYNGRGCRRKEWSSGESALPRRRHRPFPLSGPLRRGI